MPIQSAGTPPPDPARSRGRAVLAGLLCAALALLVAVAGGFGYVWVSPEPVVCGPLAAAGPHYPFGAASTFVHAGPGREGSWVYQPVSRCGPFTFYWTDHFR